MPTQYPIMDQVASLEETNLLEAVQATMNIFIPILEQQRSALHTVPKETAQYGPTSRHQLDIYRPPSGTSNKVLFFIYGGGLIRGDRSLAPPADLAYRNVAAYFVTKANYTVVIPDYRLVPHVTFPGPAEDVRDAVIWTRKHLEKEMNGNVDIFIMGHSAGALHLFTMLALFDPTIVKGAILSSGPYVFKPEYVPPGLDGVIPKYFGSLEAAEKLCPLELLKALPEEKRTKLPALLLVEAENDPVFIKIPGQVFHESLGTDVQKIYGKGHNHFSLFWCLSTGEGEEWAEGVIAWIEAQN